MTPTPIFGGLNFANIANDPNFNEETVRAEISEPILKRLGYRRENILRNRPLLAQVGTKKREMSIPDYILAIGQYNAFVLEAKAPNQVIKDGSNVEQAFSYAMHNEVQSKYFALCNGLEFNVFKTEVNRTLVLSLPLDEVEARWSELAWFLSIKRFHTGYHVQYRKKVKTFDYVNRPFLITHFAAFAKRYDTERANDIGRVIGHCGTRCQRLETQADGVAAVWVGTRIRRILNR